jgi:hypothetical protein
LYTVAATFLAAMQLSAINAMFLPLLLRYKSFGINPTYEDLNNTVGSPEENKKSCYAFVSYHVREVS